MTRSLCLAMVLTFSLSACTTLTWPPERGGGVAEFAPSERWRQTAISISPELMSLYGQLSELESLLEIYIGQGAMRFAPAETTLARKLAIRIRREIAGDLLSNAAQDIIALGDRLSAIRRQISNSPEVEPTRSL